MRNANGRDPARALARREAVGAADAAAAVARFADRAQAEGALDVAYAVADTPLGTALLASTRRGLVRVGLPGHDRDLLLAELAAGISPRLLEAPARLDEARRELDEYFRGRRRGFDLALDWRLARGFRRRVLRATARIPYGETRSYGEVAASAGSPAAHRAAGSALGANPLPIVVPCHRVLRSGGAIGHYGGGSEMKRALLALEGAIPPPSAGSP